jgi:uridine kinase
MLIIGIAGGTGSGKTSVAKAVVRQLGEANAAIVSHDNYYLNNPHLSLQERALINYDHPNSLEHDLLLEHIALLQQGHAAEMPLYDFVKHERMEQTIRIEPRPIIVVEGLHTLSVEQVRAILDVKVFVDTDADIRILRRVVRDMNERGRTLDSIRSQYLTTVKPMHDAFIEPSKKYADVIIPEGARNEVGVSLLMTLMERYLNESVR